MLDIVACLAKKQSSKKPRWIFGHQGAVICSENQRENLLRISSWFFRISSWNEQKAKVDVGVSEKWRILPINQWWFLRGKYDMNHCIVTDFKGAQNSLAI